MGTARDLLRSPDPSIAAHQGPVRTCVGCRGRDARSVLLRVVAVGPPGSLRAVPDPAARLPGRGAWVHPDPACLDLAERRRAFMRALRAASAVDLAEVRELLLRLPSAQGPGQGTS